MNDEIIQNLLDEILKIVKKNNDELDRTGARFNMFQICGVNHYENTHSKILAELLNPQGSHSMKDGFLKAFLEIVIKDDFKISTAKCRIHTELSTEEGRMDIFITDNTNIICIENKIYAGDQYQQLKRYAKSLTKSSTQWKIFYLTLDGHEVSEQSGKGIENTPISYDKEIIQWLDKCIELSQDKPIVAQTLIQYKYHIKKLTGTSLEEKYMDQTKELILKNRDNLAAAIEVKRILDDDAIYNLLLEPFIENLKEYLQEKFNNTNIEGESDMVYLQKFSHFTFSFANNKFYLKFEFQRKRFDDLRFGIWGNKRLKKIPGFEWRDLGANGASVTKKISYLWSDNIWGTLVDVNSDDYKRLLEEYKNELDLVIQTVKDLLQK